MQVLYSMMRDESVSRDAVIQRYERLTTRSYQSFLLALSNFIRIARYARDDAERRKKKLRPTPKDLQFTSKLGDNPLIESLVTNDGLQRLFTQNKIPAWTDKDKIRDLYVSFAKTEAYQEYLTTDSTPDHHRQILLVLFKHLTGNENFNEIQEDFNALWQDDKSLVVGAIKKIIKSLPVEDNFYEKYSLDHDTVEAFGLELLLDVYDNNQSYLDIIEPALNNWDSERVALLDMILIKMGLSEFLQFESIPTKVTLNEFVDLAKIYSTDKSKEFINGILDALLKQLGKDGLIVKAGRGLMG